MDLGVNDTDFDTMVQALATHFDGRNMVQLSRFEFFYSKATKRWDNESKADWAGRLTKLGEKCNFSADPTDGMTLKEAVELVLVRRQMNEPPAKGKSPGGNPGPNVRLGVSPGGSGPKVIAAHGAYKTEANDSFDQEFEDNEPMPVEIQWGDGSQPSGQIITSAAPTLSNITAITNAGQKRKNPINWTTVPSKFPGGRFCNRQNHHCFLYSPAWSSG